MELYRAQQIARIIRSGAEGNKGFDRSLREDKSKFIYAQFPVYYSAILEYDKLAEPSLKKLLWDNLLKAFELLLRAMDSSLRGDNEISRREAFEFKTLLKMYAYILMELVHCVVEEKSKPDAEDLLVRKKRRGHKKSVTSEGSKRFDWAVYRMPLLTHLHTLMELPFQRLWDPPVAEESLYNCLITACFKMTEDPTVVHVKSSDWRRSVISVLGIAVRDHEQTSKVTDKIFSVMERLDHIPVVLVEMVFCFVDIYANDRALIELLRNFSSAKILIDDVEDKADLKTKNFCAILQGLSEKIPHVFVSHSQNLMELLDVPSPVIRATVFSMMCHIWKNVLAADSSPEAEKLRKWFFYYLTDHLLDIASVVRTRIVNCFDGMVQAHVIPPGWYNYLTRAIIGRLNDVSALVRKGALKCLSSLVLKNPFCEQLSRTLMEREVKELEETIRKMEASVNEAERKQQRTKWVGIVNKCVERISKELSRRQSKNENPTETSQGVSDESDDDDSDVTLRANESENEAGESEISSKQSESEENKKHEQFMIYIRAVRRHLNEENVKEALRLLRMCRKRFPKHKLFQTGALPNDSADDATREQGHMIACLQQIFFSNDVKEEEVKEDDFEEDNEDDEEEAFEFPANEQYDVLTEGQESLSELEKNKNLLIYMNDGIQFALLVEGTLKRTIQLLKSKTTNDVTEAIDYFLALHEIDFNETLQAKREILSLVWAKDQTIKDSACTAMRKILFTNKQAPPEKLNYFIARQLLHMMSKIKPIHRSSLERLFKVFDQEKAFKAGIMNELWNCVNESEEFVQVGAIDTLSAICKCRNREKDAFQFVEKVAEVLIVPGSVVEGNEEVTSPYLMTHICLAVKEVFEEYISSKRKSAAKRLLPSDPMYSALTSWIFRVLFHYPVEEVCPALNEIVNAIYVSALNAEEIIFRLFSEFLNRIRELYVGENETSELHAHKLYTALITVMGQSALCQADMTEVYFYEELKQKNKDQAGEGRTAFLVLSQSSSTSSSGSPTGTPKRKSRLRLDHDESMVGMCEYNVQDKELELVTDICNAWIVRNPKSSPWAAFLPLLLHVVRHPDTFTDTNLQRAGVACLVKMMCISQHCCEENLKLVFTLLVKSRDEAIRCLIIRSLYDMAFKFPNAIEPWSERIYLCLRDKSASVRLDALKLLSRLIMADMLRVKGNIAEIAACILDSDTEVVNRAKSFFRDLTCKKAALYNSLSDIISNLSDPQRKMPEEGFHMVIKFLLGLIGKEKQIHGLISRLFPRFKICLEERQWRDLAYCLAQFDYNEQAFRCLQSSFNDFKHALYEKKVFACFSSILNSCRKGVKADTKGAVDELEDNMKKAAEKGQELVDALRAAERKSRASAIVTSTPHVSAESGELRERMVAEGMTPIVSSQPESALEEENMDEYIAKNVPQSSEQEKMSNTVLEATMVVLTPRGREVEGRTREKAVEVSPAEKSQEVEGSLNDGEESWIDERGTSIEDLEEPVEEEEDPEGMPQKKRAKGQKDSPVQESSEEASDPPMKKTPTPAKRVLRGQRTEEAIAPKTSVQNRAAGKKLEEQIDSSESSSSSPATRRTSSRSSAKKKAEDPPTATRGRRAQKVEETDSQISSGSSGGRQSRTRRGRMESPKTQELPPRSRRSPRSSSTSEKQSRTGKKASQEEQEETAPRRQLRGKRN